MGVIATALRHLMAAGVTGDALVTAITEIEAELAATALPGEPQRSSGALRTERYRARKAAEASQNPSHVTLGDVCDAETVTGVTDVTVRDACDVSAHPSLPLPPNEINSNPPAPTHPDNTTRARKSSAQPDKPDGVRAQVWSDFLSIRKAKRAPLTETALAGIRREAQSAGWPLDAALAECVSRGWQGFKAEWVRDAKPPRPTIGLVDELPPPVSRTEREWRALMGDEEFERSRHRLKIQEAAAN